MQGQVYIGTTTCRANNKTRSITITEISQKLCYHKRKFLFTETTFQFDIYTHAPTPTPAPHISSSHTLMHLHRHSCTCTHAHVYTSAVARDEGYKLLLRGRPILMMSFSKRNIFISGWVGGMVFGIKKILKIIREMLTTSG